MTNLSVLDSNDDDDAPDVITIHPGEIAHPWWCDGTADTSRPFVSDDGTIWVTHRATLLGGHAGHLTVELQRVDIIDLRKVRVRECPQEVVVRHARTTMTPKQAAAYSAALSAAAGMAAVKRADREPVGALFFPATPGAAYTGAGWPVLEGDLHGPGPLGYSGVTGCPNGV